MAQGKWRMLAVKRVEEVGQGKNEVDLADPSALPTLPGESN